MHPLDEFQRKFHAMIEERFLYTNVLEKANNLLMFPVYMTMFL